MKTSLESLKIAIAYPTSLPWMARLLDGVRRYGLQYGGWRIITSPPSIAATGEHHRSLASLVGWDGDAAIAAINNEEDRLLARQLGFPVINLSGWNADLHDLPRVSVDNFQAGRLAAAHLLESGLTNFAYLGWEAVYYSDERLAGFRSAIEETGHQVLTLLEEPGDPAESNSPTLADEMRGLGSWLESLPTPCGIFAVQDYRAQLLMEACENAGLRVARDIAVVGMDNDTIVCEHSIPTLTSISRNSSQIGWEAAALIDRILRGNETVTQVLVPPDIVMRQSTDLFHHPEEIIQVAVTFMIRHLKDRPKMDAVARHAGVSKRTLEARFRAGTGQSPHQYFNGLRIEQAKRLLRRPSRPAVTRVAADCGFASYPAFAAAFENLTGQTPGQFRDTPTGSAGL